MTEKPSASTQADLPPLAFDDLGCTERERALFSAAAAELEAAGEPGPFALGRVVSLDRSLPLVMSEKDVFRAEHDVRMAKENQLLPAIGDWVVAALPQGHDQGIIEQVLPRARTFARRDPHNPDGMQVLAANIDEALVIHPLSASNIDAHRLERELVIAWESGAVPSLILTKADATTPEHLEQMLEVAGIVAPGAQVVVESAVTGEGVEQVRRLVPPGTTAVVVGRSGAGKSTLINRLLGAEVLTTGAVRATDGAGRHTTVSRQMVAIPGGGVIIDAPGMRNVALADAWGGLEAAFPEIVALEGTCRFRDCKHRSEPGCEVQAAISRGEVDARRLASYQELRDEMVELQDRLRRSGRSERRQAGGRGKRKRR